MILGERRLDLSLIMHQGLLWLKIVIKAKAGMVLSISEVSGLLGSIKCSIISY